MTRVATNPFPTAYPALRQTWTIAFGTTPRGFIGLVPPRSNAIVRRISGRIAFA